MNSVYIVYWSGTGNTETMANMIAEGVIAGGGNALVKEVSTLSSNDLDESKVFALGCPSMGAEELEEDYMEPFVAELESKISGKHILLFGSYGWGDGEWMRIWTQRMRDCGAIIISDEGIIANDAPDEEAKDRLIQAGKILASM